MEYYMAVILELLELHYRIPSVSANLSMGVNIDFVSTWSLLDCFLSSYIYISCPRLSSTNPSWDYMLPPTDHIHVKHGSTLAISTWTKPVANNINPKRQNNLQHHSEISVRKFSAQDPHLDKNLSLIPPLSSHHQSLPL